MIASQHWAQIVRVVDQADRPWRTQTMLTRVLVPRYSYNPYPSIGRLVDDIDHLPQPAEVAGGRSGSADAADAARCVSLASSGRAAVCSKVPAHDDVGELVADAFQHRVGQPAAAAAAPGRRGRSACCDRRGRSSSTSATASSTESVTLNSAMSAGEISSRASSTSRDVLAPVHPVIAARLVDHDDGKEMALAGLHQRQHLEAFVLGAEAAGEQGDGVGFLHEQQLAREEVFQVHQLRVAAR